MTILQDNSKLQGHPNLFANHRSLEKLFTYLKKNITAALLISCHLLFLTIKPAVSCMLAHSLCKEFCKAKNMMHWVPAIYEYPLKKSLHMPHRYCTLLLFHWADIQTVANSIGWFCTWTGNTISVIDCSSTYSRDLGHILSRHATMQLLWPQRICGSLQ